VFNVSLQLIFDGTVVRVRLGKKATSFSLLVALGVREDGQKVMLAVENMGGESEAAWRAFLDDLVKRGLKVSSNSESFALKTKRRPQSGMRFSPHEPCNAPESFIALRLNVCTQPAPPRDVDSNRSLAAGQSLQQNFYEQL